MKFKPHGKASCTLDGQLILLDLEGPWNAELMLQIQHDVDSLKASLPTNKKWGLLVIVSNSLLCSFDTIEIIKNVVKEDQRHHGHAVIGFVVDPVVEGCGIVDVIFRKIYENICPIEFFETMSEARSWVEIYLRDS
jgi:hypothetical protein